MTAIEANVEALWFAKQSAKGTPAGAPATAAAGKRFRKVGGGASPTLAHNNENYSDGNRFQDATDFVDSIVGNGAPVFQMGAADGAYLCYLIMGQETHTAGTPPAVNTKTYTPGTGSFWFTAWKKVGSSLVVRQKHNDCRMTSLRIEGSSANKVVKATPTFFSLDSGEVYTTDPTVVVGADQPFLYTEAEGTFTIDGVVINGQSSFALVINDNLGTWQGDGVYMHDVFTGPGTVAVEGITLLVDQKGLDQYNKIVYGSASPSAGTKPQKTVYTGTYEFKLKRGTVGAATERSFYVELPKVHWNPDVAIDGSPDGGAVELSLAAEARIASGQPIVRVTVKTDDVAFT